MCKKKNKIVLSFIVFLLTFVSVGQVTAYGQKQVDDIPEIYVVKKGDTLWQISKMWYGDGSKWTVIWEKNKKIKNPHRIYPGQTILIGPEVEKIEEPTAPPPQPVEIPEPAAVKAVPQIPEAIETKAVPQIPEIAYKKEATVRILFTNNSNGKLKDCNCPTDPYGGLAERVSLMREYRERYSDILLLDSGGYFGLSRVEKNGPIVLELMELMEYDTWGIGDQELYHGLARFLNSFGSSSDSIVNASLSTKDGNPVFTPYRIFTVQDVRIGILGLLAEETFRFFPADNRDFTVENPDSTLTRFLPELKRSCDYIVVLSQRGREKDIETAKKWPGIDLIIGGHSQTLLEKAIHISDCRIVQAGKNGGRVGEILVRFDQEKEVTDFAYKLFKVTDRYKISPDIQKIIE